MKKKNLFKRIVASVLTLALVFNVVPMGVFAEENTPQVGDIVKTASSGEKPESVLDGVWVEGESKSCSLPEHIHSSECYVKTCTHKNGHLPTCYGATWGVCPNADTHEHTESYFITWNTITGLKNLPGIGDFIKSYGLSAYKLYDKTVCYSIDVNQLNCEHVCTEFTGTEEGCYGFKSIIDGGCGGLSHEHNLDCTYCKWTLHADINNNGNPDENETYTIKYVNWDGTELQSSEHLVDTTYPIYEGTPERPSDAQYTYNFIGWDKAAADKVTADVTHTAQFSETVNKYTVTWKNHDNTVLETDENVPYGEKVSYDGETPAKQAAEGENKVYTFAGWDPEVTDGTVVEGNMVFTATFSDKDIFTVKYNVDGASATKYVIDGEKAEDYAPTKLYYVLNGWYTSTNCAEGTKFNFETTAITESIELFAKWVPVKDDNSDGIADEEQICDIKVNGDVTYKIEGNKIPGMEITITATPKENRYITGVIKVNGNVYTGEVTFNKGVATFKYTLPTVMAVDASECTIEIETADASVTLKSAFLNWNKLMTAEETVANIIANVNFGEMPATVAENTEVKYLEYNVIVKSWKDIGSDVTPLVGHAFGEKSEETVRLTFAGNDQVPGFTKEFKVTLKDERLASKIEAKNVTFTYSPSVTKAEMEKAIFDAAFVAATSEDGTVTLDAVYGENVFVENANVNAGTHTVTIEFYGTSKYAKSTAEITVTVKKADSYTNVSESNVKYGTEVNASALIDTGAAKRVELVAGLSMGANVFEDAKTIVYLNMPELIDTSVIPEILRPTVDNLLSGLTEGAELSVSELNTYLTGILKTLEDYNIDDIPGVNIDSNTISSLISVLENLEKIEGIGDIVIKVSFGGELKLTDAGMYIVGAVVSDANYNTSFGANYVVITPDGYKAELGWNREDENGVITRNAIVNKTFDFGASVTKVYEGTVEEAQAYLTTFFMGVDANGEATVTYDPSELKFGVYTQIAMLKDAGNTMYYAEPIVRVFSVVPQIAEVKVVDSEAVYNGESHKVSVNVNGSEYEGEGLTVKYVGVDTNGNVYNSTQAPVNTGVYTVYATYAVKVDGIYEYAGFDAGVLVIKPATATLEVEDTYVIYDGNEHMPTIKNENNLDLIKVIVDENNNVNVVFPFEVETKTVNVAEATAELKAVIAATGKGYATAEAISNKLVAELNKIDHEKLTAMGAEELATFIAELKAEAVKASETFAKYDVDAVTAELVKLLNKVKVNEFTVNGTLPTEDGVYEVTVIGFGANYKPATATGTLTIHEHIPAAAVKENNVDPDCENPGSYDEVVYCTECEEELSRVTVPVAKDMSNHVGTEQWAKTSTTHKKYWDCCETVTVTEAEHNWKDGKCEDCEYVCEHSGETEVRGAKPATETKDGYTGDTYCKVCGKLIKRGEIIPATGTNPTPTPTPGSGNEGGGNTGSTAGTTTTTTGTTGRTNPNTSDISMTVFWMFIAAVSGATVMAMLIFKRKREE